MAEQTSEKPANFPRPPEREKLKPRVSFATNEAGKIDVKALHADSREKLRSILSDDALRRELGVSGAVSSKNSTKADPLMLADMVLLVTGALCVKAATLFGYGMDDAKVMAFPPEERKELAPAVVPVIEKYMVNLGPYDAEIGAAFAVGGILVAKSIQLQRSAKVIEMPRGPQAAPDTGRAL